MDAELLFFFLLFIKRKASAEMSSLILTSPCFLLFLLFFHLFVKM